MSASRPQLKMERPHLDDLPPMQVPEPYGIRSYRPNDEVLWTELVGVAMNSSWTVEACRKNIIAAPGFDPEGMFFAVMGEKVVGTACAFHDEQNPPDRGTVHMVCVHPDPSRLPPGILALSRGVVPLPQAQLSLCATAYRRRAPNCSPHLPEAWLQAVNEP